MIIVSANETAQHFVLPDCRVENSFALCKIVPVLDRPFGSIRKSKKGVAATELFNRYRVALVDQ
jgi:hypothetical protein